MPSSTYNMNHKFNIILLVGVAAILGGSILSISISSANAQSNYSIKVAKTTDSDFTVSNGASYVGSSFDSIYVITGTQADFIKARDTLISSVTDDFDKSPTIGYIKMSNTNAQASGNMTGNATGLANPFVSQDQVNAKIKSVLNYAIDKIENPTGIQLQIGDSKEVKGKFGNVLNDFWCDIPTFSVK
jgi:hypothetical protein